MTQYPVVALLLKHGAWLAIVAAAMPVLFALVAMLAGAHWLVLLAAVLAAPVVYVLLKSYVELVAIIADMLLPK
jgi:hypothetical protein